MAAMWVALLVLRKADHSVDLSGEALVVTKGVTKVASRAVDSVSTSAVTKEQKMVAQLVVCSVVMLAAY